MRLGLALILMALSLAARPQRPGDAATARQAIRLGERGLQPLSRPQWSVSADGRFVAFTSRRSQDVAADTNPVRDVYVFDRSAGALTRETGTPLGGVADGDSSLPDISEDGRFLVFVSIASNLVERVNTGVVPRVYLRDRQAGTTHLVSDWSTHPAISDDGSTVVFHTIGPPGGSASVEPQIELVHRASGLRQRVSVNSRGQTLAGQSVSPAVDATGRYVVFMSRADLTTRPDARDDNGVADVYLRDLWHATTRLVSRSHRGGASNGASYQPTISADGQHVVFVSAATNLVPGSRSATPQIYAFDVARGHTVLVSRDARGRPANAPSGFPVVSRDGHRIAFQSQASGLMRCASCDGAIRDVNLLWDVFLRDMRTGATWLVTHDVYGAVGGHGPMIDADGQVLAYASREPRDREDVGEDLDLFVLELR